MSKYNFKRAINTAVSRYARADSTFIHDVRDIAKHAGACTEKRWQAEFSPLFKAALDNYTPGSADVILSRVKVAFLCEANGVTPKGCDDLPLTSLRATYEQGRPALAKAGVLKPQKVRKGANARKGEKAKGKAATATALPPIKPGAPHSIEELRFAALMLTDSPKLAGELAGLMSSDKDAAGDLRKLLRTFIDGRKA
jgi:hypothetical protein